MSALSYQTYMGIKVRDDATDDLQKYVAIGNSELHLKKVAGGASFTVSVNYSVWDSKQDCLDNELPKRTERIQIPLDRAELPQVYEKLYKAIVDATAGVVEDDVPEKTAEETSKSAEPDGGAVTFP
jgi:hypothetical protein